MGPADYLSIASSFHTVVITDVPVLKLSSKNQARRFISLVDALYEARCRIVCLAEAAPEDLFFPDVVAEPTSPGAATASDALHAHDTIDVLLAEAVGETRDVYRPNVASYDAPNMAEAPAVPHAPVALETLSMFSGKEEQFAYKRALSRLREMTSEGYGKEETWAPLPAAERKWERSARVAATSSSASRRSVPAAATVDAAVAMSNVHIADAAFDFAVEAAYQGDSTVQVDVRQRPEAPRLREEHVWGVRDDWGGRAKEWGRGAKAYEEQKSKERGGSS